MTTTSAASTIYYSKISWGLLLFFALGLVIALGIMLVTGVWLGVAIIVLTALLPLSVFRNTHYEIKADELLITSGFLFKQTIPIASIRSIRPTRTIIASPALSFDRQEIKYGQYNSVNISLKEADKRSFYGQLKRINPQIMLG